VTESTITVLTGDHGPVTVTEPLWCLGEHPAGLRREEIIHQGASHDITVGTERGPRRLLELFLTQAPFPVASDRHSDDLYVAVHLLDGDIFGYDVIGLENLATDLLEAAATVRRCARRLAIEQRLGGAR